MHRRAGRLLEWWARWERHFAVLSMVTGFCFDLIVAKRPDSLFDNLLLLFYLCVAAACIILLNRRAHSGGELRPQPLLLLLILQFCFGGLSSNLLVLYGKSGTPAGDVLFIALLLAMLIGNEFLRSRYEQMRFQLAVYYVLLLTYCIIAVPTFLLHAIGFGAFFVSGLVSFTAMTVFLAGVRRTTALFRGDLGTRRLHEARIIIVGIFLFFALLYGTNIIPPVPLSLKTIGVYHFLAKDSSDSYEGQYEPAPWWEFWQRTSGTYHATAGEGAYCFSSVFAPSGLSTPILHRWEFNDPAGGGWITEAEVSFPISGGRANGYRGFSEKLKLMPGLWRCDVETDGGALIGRVEFTVVSATQTPPLAAASL